MPRGRHRSQGKSGIGQMIKEFPDNSLGGSWLSVALRGQVNQFSTGHKENDPVSKPGLQACRLHAAVRAMFSSRYHHSE